MTNPVALRAGIPPFYVMDVWLAAAERQRSHGDLVNLSAGQPAAQAPAPIRAAAAEALANDNLGYTVALGIPELREAIAKSYLDRYGVEVEPDAVVITTGSTGVSEKQAIDCELVTPANAAQYGLFGKK